MKGSQTGSKSDYVKPELGLQVGKKGNKKKNPRKSNTKAGSLKSPTTGTADTAPGVFLESWYSSPGREQRRGTAAGTKEFLGLHDVPAQQAAITHVDLLVLCNYVTRTCLRQASSDGL